MTIIVWDGTTLVADRRITTHGVKQDVFQQEATKITTFEDTKFNKGEELLVVGFTGQVGVYRKIIATIEKHREDNPDAYVRTIVNSLIDSQFMVPSFACLFITDKAIHYIRNLRGQPPVESANRLWRRASHEQFTALGSAEMGASVLHDIFEGTLTAREVLFLTTKSSKSLGGGFDQWSLKDPKIKRGRCLTTKQKETLGTRLNKLLINHSINH